MSFTLWESRLPLLFRLIEISIKIETGLLLWVALVRPADEPWLKNCQFNLSIW